MFSPLADPQILFKGCGISVDETEAPLPGKLDYVEGDESFSSEIKREECARKPIRINPIPFNICPLKEAKHQDRSKINESGITSTKQAKGFLKPTYIPSSPVVSQIVFEKWEIDVDDIEAPLPDPFDYAEDYKNPPRQTKQKKRTFKPPFIHQSSATIDSLPRGLKHQDRSKISTEQIKDLLKSIRIPSPTVAPQIGFERWEIDTDDIEAPLPDPFNYVEEPVNRTSRNKLLHSWDTSTRTPFPLLQTGHSEGVVEVQKEASREGRRKRSRGPEEQETDTEVHESQRKSERKSKRVRRGTLEGKFGPGTITPNEQVKKTLAAKAFNAPIAPRNAFDNSDTEVDTTEALPSSLPGFQMSAITGPDWKLPKLSFILSSWLLQNGIEPSQAMYELQRAAMSVPAPEPDYHSRACHLNTRARKLRRNYERTGAMGDLQQAIVYSQESLAETPQGHPNRPLFLDNMAAHLGARCDQTGAIDDLQQAILYSQEALAATPQDHKRSCYLNMFAGYLATRYNHTGAIVDLQQAILYSQEALAATSQDHPERACHLNDLAGRLVVRYHHTGAMDDLQQAILYTEIALAATPQRHPHRARYLSKFADRLVVRYHQIGAIVDLQQAILYSQEALAATPQNHLERASRLDSLASHLVARYNRSGAVDDLQQAVFYGQGALAATPQDHPKRACRLKDLASHLSTKYSRTEDMSDLQKAVLYAQQALEATPQNSSHRASHLGNLASLLRTRYRQTGAMDDLQQSILYDQEILAATPQDYYQRTCLLHSLASGLSAKYNQTRVMDDLLQAVSYDEKALAATPQGHPHQAKHLRQVASRLLTKGRVIGRSEDIVQCIVYLKESWDCNNSSPSDRISAALQLFSVSCELLQCTGYQHPYHSDRSLRSKGLNHILKDLDSTLEDAVLLLPKVSLRSLEQQDHQYNLSALGGLAEGAASCALAVGKPPYHALKLLELSRGIIMGHSIDCRGDLSDLKETDPKLYNTFDQLRTEIDTPMSTSCNDLFAIHPSNPKLPEQAAAHDHDEGLAKKIRDRTQDKKRREEAIEKMEQTIAKIRNLPGHERFQLPPSPKQLMSMAENGPIVVFISTTIRSDAIIVTHSTINSIALPKLLHHEIPKWRQEIDKLMKGEGGKGVTLRTSAPRNKEMRKHLLWLWDVAIEPVIQELGFTAKSADDADLPHIWWVGVGSLSTAPFHAAGDHSPGSEKNTLSYATSSYTPTIKALLYAREKNLTIVDDNKSNGSKPGTKLLLATMSTTPGQKSLPDAEEEVARILEIASGSVLTEHLSQPSAKDILDQLQKGTCHAVHFACHGISDGKDPSSSHLVLVKDGKADRLTAQDISSRNTGAAQLAYLSACSTADNPVVELGDETIHIASGFQLAGFSHVLGAMWPSESKVCMEISADFYQSLFDGNGSGHRKVRIAFHKAMVNAQRKYWNTPLKWAQFIHMGA